SPDGKNVYVTGKDSNALTIFGRYPDTSVGELWLHASLAEGSDVTYGLAAPTGVAVAPDSTEAHEHFFVSSSADNALSEYRGDLTHGYTQVGMWRNGFPNPIGGTVSGLMGASGVVATAGTFGTDVYVSSATESSVSAFTTDPLLRLYQAQVVTDGVLGYDGLA